MVSEKLWGNATWKNAYSVLFVNRAFLKRHENSVVILTCSVRNRWVEEKERVAFGFASIALIINSKC